MQDESRNWRSAATTSYCERILAGRFGGPLFYVLEVVAAGARRSIPERGHANLNSHARIAKRGNAEAGPDRLMARHTRAELARHFGGRGQDRPVSFRNVIRVNVSDV